jgi:hypothetical protein
LRRLFPIRLIAVSCGGGGSGFGFRGLFAGANPSGAVVTFLLHIVVFRHRGDKRRPAADLADPAENDLGPAFVEFDRTVNFDDTALQSANVAYIFKIRIEDDDGEGAGCPLFAKIYEVYFRPCFYPRYFAHDAFVLADVLAGFADGQAVGGEGWGAEEQGYRRDNFDGGGETAHCRALPGWTAGGRCACMVRPESHASILKTKLPTPAADRK